MYTVKQTASVCSLFRNSAVPQPHNHTQARKPIHANQSTKEKCMSRQLAYFAGDGNYGMENGNFVLVDVSKWTDEDWQRIEESSDSRRPSIAMSISVCYE